MRFIKISGTIFAGALFLTSCNLLGTDQTAETNPYPNDVVQQEIVSDANDYYGRENFDLQAVGPLLERAESAEELEYLLNSDNRINNLDLNQDGYVDYIGVREFDDRNNGERGLSLFSRFGPDLIQEIATIIFDRNNVDSRGARILLAGNEQLYGDNYYHEANWLDRALPIVSWLFSDRNSNYSSPYYYGNYPDYYENYEVVETPVYQTRIREFYNEPVFIQTSSPAINQIEINSPYEGRTISNVYPKPGKMTKEEKEIWKNNRKNNQGPPEVVPVRNGWLKNGGPKSNKKTEESSNDFERPRKNNDEKFEKRGNPNSARRDHPKFVKVDRVDQPKPQRAEKPNFNPNKPIKADKPDMKPPKADNPGGGKGKGNNPGNGGGKGNKGGGGGNGKGDGKKN